MNIKEKYNIEPQYRSCHEQKVLNPQAPTQFFIS